jgi:hypothetical protein
VVFFGNGFSIGKSFNEPSYHYRPYLPFSIIIPLHFLISWDFRVYIPKKGLSLILWEEGDKCLEGLVLGKREKPYIKLTDALPRDHPRKK